MYAGFCPAGRPAVVAIHLGEPLPTHSSGLPGIIGRAARSLSDLAPDGVYRAGRVAPSAGALLPHRCTLTCASEPESRRHRRSVLCGTVLRVTPTGRYPAPCPVESGRSSAGSDRAIAPDAATRPAHHRPPVSHVDRGPGTGATGGERIRAGGRTRRCARWRRGRGSAGRVGGASAHRRARRDHRPRRPRVPPRCRRGRAARAWG